MRTSSRLRRCRVNFPSAQRCNAAPSSPSCTWVRKPSRPALTPSTGMPAGLACWAVQSMVPSPPKLTMSRVPSRSSVKAPGRSSDVAQYVQTRNPRRSSSWTALTIGGPLKLIRGWHTMPTRPRWFDSGESTGSGMGSQMDEKFSIPLSAEERRDNLAGDLVADLPGKTDQLAEHALVLDRVTHDATLTQEPLPHLELRFDQCDHVPGWATQLANAGQHEPEGDE